LRTKWYYFFFVYRFFFLLLTGLVLLPSDGGDFLVEGDFNGFLCIDSKITCEQWSDEAKFTVYRVGNVISLVYDGFYLRQALLAPIKITKGGKVRSPGVSSNTLELFSVHMVGDRSILRSVIDPTLILGENCDGIVKLHPTSTENPTWKFIKFPGEVPAEGKYFHIQHKLTGQYLCEGDTINTFPLCQSPSPIALR